jgi:hypothetical protein
LSDRSSFVDGHFFISFQDLPEQGLDFRRRPARYTQVYPAPRDPRWKYMDIGFVCQLRVREGSFVGVSGLPKTSWYTGNFEWPSLFYRWHHNT